MKKLLVLLVAAALLIPAIGLAKKKPKDVTGTYTVNGYNPGVATSGTPNYTGTLEVAQSEGAYTLTWTVGTTEKPQVYKGVGVYSNGILSANFFGEKNEGGVMSYKVEGNVMKGVWAPNTGGQFGYEFAERR